MNGNILGNIIFATTTGGIITALVVDVIRTEQRKRAAFRKRIADYRAAHPAIAAHWSDPDSLTDPLDGKSPISNPKIVIEPKRTVGKHPALAAPYGGGSMSTTGRDTPCVPVDFAALRGQPIKAWEHAAGDPTPRPEHYEAPAIPSVDYAVGSMVGDRFYVPEKPSTRSGWVVKDRDHLSRSIGLYDHRKSALRKARQMNAADAACPPLPMAQRTRHG